MKIALAQINVHIGNFESNFQKIANNIEQAEKLNVDVILFPELCLCGYPPRDFLNFDDFIDNCYEIIEKIKPLSPAVW